MKYRNLLSNKKFCLKSRAEFLSGKAALKPMLHHPRPHGNSCK